MKKNELKEGKIPLRSVHIHKRIHDMSFRKGGSSGNSFMKNLPFGLGYDDITSNETTEFPKIPLPVNNPITSRERSLAVTYINFGKTIRDGPFYTGSMSLAVEKTDNGKKKHALVDEEGEKDGIERYSDRYLKKRNIGASIDEHPYHLEIFPKELYNVMGINKKKLLTLSRFDNTDNIFTGGNAQDELSMLEKLKEMAEDEDNEEENREEGRAGDDVGDDDFDDEDDDDDYNAEKYFDDGDDDDYGDDDAGDEPAF